MYDLRAQLVLIRQYLEAQATGSNAKPVEALPMPRTLLDEIRTSLREQARAELVDELKHAFGYRQPPD